MPRYVVVNRPFEQGTDEEKAPGELVTLTEEQAEPFVKTKRLAPYSEPKTARKVEGHELPPDKPKAQPAPEPSAFAQEVEKHKLLPDDLPGLTIKRLTALPEWEQVPDPKPTGKAKILAAIRAVREE